MNTKNAIFAFIIILCLMLLLVGCTVKNQPGLDEAIKEYRMVILSDVYGVSEHEALMYDKETKVMYIYYARGYGGGFTPLYNPDGSLMLYSVDTNVE